MDKEIKRAVEVNNDQIPSSTKIALLVQMFLEACSKDLKFRHVQGQHDFEKMRKSILDVAVVKWLEQLNQGVKDMDVDSVRTGHHQKPEEVWTHNE